MLMCLKPSTKEQIESHKLYEADLKLEREKEKEKQPTTASKKDRARTHYAKICVRACIVPRARGNVRYSIVCVCRPDRPDSSGLCVCYLNTFGKGPLLPSPPRRLAETRSLW